MALKETYEKQGAFLFRGRSYLPLLVAPLVVAAILDPQYTHPLFSGFSGSPGNDLHPHSFTGLLVRAS